MIVFIKGNRGNIPNQDFVFSAYEAEYDLKSAGLERLKISTARLDSKGRICVPNFVRKALGLGSGDLVEIVFDIREDCFIVRNGVSGSMEDCGASGLGSSPNSGPGEDI